MQTGKIHIVTDGNFGSTAKGFVMTALAHKYRPQHLSTTSMANAGHTAVNVDGESYLAKALPSAAILNKWYDYKPTVHIGATAAFHLNRLLEEKQLTGLSDNQLIIHERAGVITDEHAQAEKTGNNSTKHVASTMQGCGTYLADKILRKPTLKLARDYQELQSFIHKGHHATHLHELLRNGETILHEGSQGYSLDINHGCQYPNCTSRGTTAIQNLADLGLSHQQIGEVILVVRPTPIRVGNVIENGITVGYSGDCYPDQEETTWQKVGENAGMPQTEIDKLNHTELTSVTKRLRRVYTFSGQQIKEAAAINGATQIALTFANYIDYNTYGATKPEQLTEKVYEFIDKIQFLTNTPVTIVGTGPRLDQIVWLGNHSNTKQ